MGARGGSFVDVGAAAGSRFISRSRDAADAERVGPKASGVRGRGCSYRYFGPAASATCSASSVCPADDGRAAAGCADDGRTGGTGGVVGMLCTRLGWLADVCSRSRLARSSAISSVSALFAVRAALNEE